MDKEKRKEIILRSNVYCFSPVPGWNKKEVREKISRWPLDKLTRYFENGFPCHVCCKRGKKEECPLLEGYLDYSYIQRPRDHRRPYIIQKTKTMKRGFGSCTFVIFRNEKREWDYVEAVQEGAGEYQRTCHYLDEKQCNKLLIGRDIREWKKLEKELKIEFIGGEIPERYFGGKWHHVTFDLEGNVISAWC